jgi:hypothetical protein
VIQIIYVVSEGQVIHPPTKHFGEVESERSIFVLYILTDRHCLPRVLFKTVLLHKITYSVFISEFN